MEVHETASSGALPLPIDVPVRPKRHAIPPIGSGQDLLELVQHNCQVLSRPAGAQGKGRPARRVQKHDTC